MFCFKHHSAETLPQKLHKEIHIALTKSLVPAYEYLKLFENFNSLLELDVNDYCQKYFKMDSKDTEDGRFDATQHEYSLKDVEKEINKHFAQSEKIKNLIPKSVNLGLFTLKLEPIRNSLAEKHNNIALKQQQLFTEITREKCQHLSKSFTDIKKRLQQPCKKVEDLVEMKEYINTIPNTVATLEPLISQSMDYFKLLEGFSCKLDRNDFRTKWITYAWPKAIDDQIATVNTTMTDEKKKYYEELSSQQEDFKSDISQIQSDVDSFGGFSDFSKLKDIAAQAKSLDKRIKHATKQAQIFNSKEAAFEVDITDYKEIQNASKKFEPYLQLWSTAFDWTKQHHACMNEPFAKLDPFAVEKNVDSFRRGITKCQRNNTIKSNAAVLKIADTVSQQIDDFKPQMPIVTALAQEGMRQRHWDALSTKLSIDLDPNSEKNQNFNLTMALSPDFGLDKHIAAISKEGEKANKEFQIEKALDKMEDEWQNVNFTIDPYKETKTYRLLEVDEIMQQLDEHRVTTQAMQFSAFKGPFEERIETWDNKLSLISEVIDEWLMVQRNWLHLQPIFDSADIMKQLPTEGKKFNMVDRLWRSTMENCKKNPSVITFADNEGLLAKFKDATKILDQVQKGLSDYLNTKRAAFARFYFLSDDELLQILSQTKDVKAVQPHIKKCFENIQKLEFDENLNITAMYSSSGERFPFDTMIDPKVSQVEFWLGEVESMMIQSLKSQLCQSIKDYHSMQRIEWTKISFGQSVLTMSQVAWTNEVETALNENGHKGLSEYLTKMQTEMNETVEMVRGKLDKLVRINVGAMIVLDVHNLNTVEAMVQQNVESTTDFMWISQLRYYLDSDQNDDIMVKMVQACFPYGYEYQGNSFRLVVTPLTERCYMTLMSALQLHLGGAPAGPAGTGKTETVKDLAKNVAKQCVVFNCSDSLDHLAMAKFFKGLAMSGAWACFDEFNRIDVEVLSVVAQQISSIWNAIRAKKESFVFEETEISLNPTTSVFITMNPGYAGRTELPDNLVALFRPVAMMVPDYALIAEIMLYSYGFNNAKALSKKMTATFRLCSEQLSSQDHYDYGMRAVKSVIVQAGNLKKQFPNKDEDMILLRALCDANVPKFLSQDLVLFSGITSDLFIGKKKEETDYGILMNSILKNIEDKGLQRKQTFVTKILQLYDVMCVRHGLMLVGPTGGGKTSNLHVLRDALNAVAGILDFHSVVLHTLNPKAITMGELYGEFDAITHEWTDGLVPTVVRECVADTSPNRKWICFDGVVDTLWIESMNTVLDDNKKLCLTSGEIISLSDEINMIFEVRDLSVASPATVSRCGMIYMDPTILGLEPMIKSWLNTLHKIFNVARKTFSSMFDLLLQNCLEFVRTKCVEPVPSVDNNLTRSLMNIIDCLFKPIVKQATDETLDEDEKLSPQQLNNINNAADNIFIFALMWSVGATTNTAGREKFDQFVKLIIKQFGFKCDKLPLDQSIYDIYFDMDTLTWVPWMESKVAPNFAVESIVNLPFANIIVPTQDSVRYTYFLDLLMKQDIHTLFTGNTGTGKTVNVQQYIASIDNKVYQPLVMMFSAATSAKQIQNTLDERLDTKRRQRVYGPPLGTRCLLFLDDMNMPQREIFGAQPPIEFLRQWLDHVGWWKRLPLHTFCNVMDIVMVGSMGPPGGGRNPVSERYLRHFNQIAHTDLQYSSLFNIFDTIINGKMKGGGYDESLCDNASKVVKAAIEVYFKVCDSLLPTPDKSHYTFNLRDLSSVHQGLLQCKPKFMENVDQFLRLWIHENRRVFKDRLINDEDRTWFDNLLGDKIKEHFDDISWDSIMPDEKTDRRLIFGGFMDSSAEEQEYQEIVDIKKLDTVMAEYLEEYNADVGASMPMNLVLFADAIEHVSRISRILSLPQGNALLLGVGGSGRQSLTNLAAFVGDFQMFRIEISNNYGKQEWRDDLKSLLMQTGIEQKRTVFLFSDNQIIMESFVEDINNILNSGDVPGMWAKEDLDQITEACKIDCTKKKIEPTKLNIFAQFIDRIRANLHIVLCMSPSGEEFRTRLRMFPALVNCCTIDWFKPWPADALKAVAYCKIEQDEEISKVLQNAGDGDSTKNIENIVEMFVNIHQTVEEKSIIFAQMLNRYSYVTPTSYLELLNTFKNLLKLKRKEVSDVRDKLHNGVEKLEQAGKDVAELQEKLTAMQPVLQKTQVEVDEMMKKIAVDKEAAAKEEAVVSKQEAEARAKAQECAEIKADAEADLAKALPALEAATACLKDLKKADLDEVKAFRNPPSGVRLTMEVACLVLQIPPVKKKDPGTMKKYDDYWEAAQKNLLSDAKKFLETLVSFDKDSMTEKTVMKFDPYIKDPNFAVKEIEKASKACKAICMWTHAMHTYFFVARDVEPKRKRLAEATATLEVVTKQLNEAKARLQGVMDRLAELQKSYDEAVAEKERLAHEVKMCSVKLERAEKLIGGLGGEKVRWSESVVSLNEKLTCVTGDVILSAGSIAYIGAYTNDFRLQLYSQWRDKMEELTVKHTPNCDVVSTLGKPTEIRHWTICGLPTDNLSIENGIIISKSQRWPLMIDPQGQANRFIKKLSEGGAANGFDVVKLTDGKHFIRTLENGIRFGKWIIVENIFESLDPVLEPILQRAVFPVKGQLHIKLGDSTIPYNDQFKFFLTSKLPNPHYPPELQVKVTLLNFTVTPSGLQDQMLGLVVAKEAPELEIKKNELVVSSAAMKKQLEEIEDKILKLLKDAQGDILEDENLITVLADSKKMVS